MPVAQPSIIYEPAQPATPYTPPAVTLLATPTAPAWVAAGQARAALDRQCEVLAVAAFPDLTAQQRDDNSGGLPPVMALTMKRDDFTRTCELQQGG